jgi:hypothetical protein
MKATGVESANDSLRSCESVIEARHVSLQDDFPVGESKPHLLGGSAPFSTPVKR